MTSSRAPLILALLTTVLSAVALPSKAVARDVPAIIISVDWEGRDLNQANLDAMIELRRKFPELRIVHFLNAAYFTKPGVDQADVRQKIQSVIRPGDQLGLHVHGWHSLFEAAGVRPKKVETFWEQAKPQAGEDVGHEEMIEDYSVEDLRRVIKYSVDVLSKNGFHGIKTFRAGGWLAGPNVLEALVREGFVSDSSAVPLDLLRQAFNETSLLRRLTSAWSKIRSDSGPYEIKTPAGSITEFPNNSGLADYVIGEQFLQIFKDLYKSGKPATIHYGFHQESAARFLPRVTLGLTLVQKFLWWRRKSVTYTTLANEQTRHMRCENAF